MVSTSSTRWAAITLAMLGILTVVLTGVALRLDDPLSSPVVPAEDPYTHMALIREHLRDGSLDPLYGDGTVYPPGMHGFVAAVWVFTGVELYELIRIGPAILGGIGILGIALLLWRIEGPVAAFVGSLAYAVAPEIIFRTTMMAPTALDLAILPFLFYAVLETVRGRLGWIGVLAPMALFLVFAHPWVLLVIGLAGAIFLLLTYLLPWSPETAPAVSGRGVGASVAVFGLAIAFADMTAGTFRGTLNAPDWLPFGMLILMVGVVGVAIGVLSILAPRVLDKISLQTRTRKMRLWVNALAALILAGLLYGVTRPAIQNGMPDLVDLPVMFGMPILVLAAAAFITLPFLRSPLSHLGAALAIATYPFVIYNPLQSEFWPHRTAVFLGIGLVVLVGAAAGALFRVCVGATQAWMARGRPSPRRHISPALAVGVPAILVAVSLGGSVYAATPEGYADRWYRMYQPCEMDAFREIADIADNDLDATVISGSWQSKLVLAAFATDASRIWFDSSFFYSEERREDVVWNAQHEGRAVYVVIDRHLPAESPGADTSFLDGPPWDEAARYCEGLGGFDRPSLVLYAMQHEETSG